MPHLAAVINELTSSVSSQKAALSWTDSQEQAFLNAKSALSDAVMLAHPNPAADLHLTTDASDVAIGAVLAQGPYSSPEPLAFFFKKASSAERNYSAFDKELLAVYLAVRHFRHHLEARVFRVFTDHKPLVGAISNNTDRSPRQSRHLAYMSEFTTDLRHLPGAENKVADALSRLKIADVQADSPVVAVALTSPVSLDWRALADAELEEKSVMDSFPSLQMSLTLFRGLRP